MISLLAKIWAIEPVFVNILTRIASKAGDFKCRGVKIGFCRNRSLQPGLLGLSLSGNLVKPLMSLYGTEWRERGYMDSGESIWGSRSKKRRLLKNL